MSYTEFLSEHGYVAQCEQDEGGYLLHTCNCPYDREPGSEQFLCVMDMALVIGIGNVNGFVFMANQYLSYAMLRNRFDRAGRDEKKCCQINKVITITAQTQKYPLLKTPKKPKDHNAGIILSGAP